MKLESDQDLYAGLSDSELWADFHFDVTGVVREAIRRELERRKAERLINAQLKEMAEQ